GIVLLQIRLRRDRLHSPLLLLEDGSDIDERIGHETAEFRLVGLERGGRVNERTGHAKQPSSWPIGSPHGEGEKGAWLLPPPEEVREPGGGPGAPRGARTLLPFAHLLDDRERLEVAH